jgi:hypothetical protein
VDKPDPYPIHVTLSDAVSTASTSVAQVHTFPVPVRTEPGWHQQKETFMTTTTAPVSGPVWAKVDHPVGMPLELLIGVSCTAAIVRWHVARARQHRPGHFIL